MKCPKCGYNSFDYLESCKKCGNALGGFKQSIGLRSVILPAGAAIAATAAAAAVTGTMEQASPDSGGDDIFQWDIPSSEPAPATDSAGIGDFDLNLGEEPIQPAARAADPFSFDEEPAAAPAPAAPQPAPAAASSLEEFSFDLADSQEEKGDTTTPKPLEQEPAKEPADNVFGEFSFDQSEDQKADTVPSQPPGQPVNEESADSVFGEFSFDESANSDQPPIDSPAVAENSLDSGSSFSFDAFGELNEADLNKEAAVSPAEPAKETGEFDLDSFLAMDEPLSGAKGSAAAPAGAAPPGGGNELDDLFGELEDR